LTVKPSSKLRTLLIAEAANPEWPSVPLVGWSLATALARVTDAHIVTQLRNRDAFVRAGLREGIDFTAIDTERIERPLWQLATTLRGGTTLGWTTQTAISSLIYPYFEHLVWKQFGSRIKAHEFDVVHRITPLTPTASSSLAPKCAKAGVPFVVGPINGGVPWPKGFDRLRRQEREWLSYVRLLYRWLPSLRRTWRHASALLVGSRHTLSEIPQTLHAKCIYMPENAIDPLRFNRRASAQGLPLRVCFVGRLVPYKGPDMLLEAAAPLLRDGAMTLDIIGDGPMMSSLTASAAEMEVSDKVRFHGWIEHTAVQDLMCLCHAMALPSVREFGGGVVLEAMALGVVPVVVDYAGPAELVDQQVGFKVPLGTREEIVLGLRRTLREIAAAPDGLSVMAEQARARVLNHFTWQAKAEQVLQAYQWVCSPGADRPDISYGSDCAAPPRCQARN
jgi:glycosyltransferase involved in cell wall biosynthesis